MQFAIVAQVGLHYSKKLAYSSNAKKKAVRGGLGYEATCVYVCVYV